MKNKNKKLSILAIAGLTCLIPGLLVGCGNDSEPTQKSDYEFSSGIKISAENSMTTFNNAKDSAGNNARFLKSTNGGEIVALQNQGTYFFVNPKFKAEDDSKSFYIKARVNFVQKVGNALISYIDTNNTITINNNYGSNWLASSDGFYYYVSDGVNAWPTSNPSSCLQTIDAGQTFTLFSSDSFITVNGNMNNTVYASIEFYVLESNETSFAGWTFEKPKKIGLSVTFDCNYEGASTIANNITNGIEGDSFNFPTATRTGYTLEGWYENAQCTEAKHSVGNSATVGEENITYYAKWDPITYTIKFNSGVLSGDQYPVSGTTPNDLSVKYDEEKNLPKNTFTRVGFDFLGWLGNSCNTSAEYTDEQQIKNLSTVQTEINLYAVWKIKTFTVKFYDSEESMNNNSNPFNTISEVTYGTTAGSWYANNFEKPTKEGYLFEGWYVKTGETEPKVTDTLKVKSDLNLFAKYTANTYTISYSDGVTDGSVSGNTNSSTHTYDIKNVLTSNGFTRTGYTFVGWATSSEGEKVYDDSEEVKNLTSENNGQITLYAVWKVDEYTYTLGLNQGTLSENYNGNPQDKSNFVYLYTYGNETELPTESEITKEGYEFKGWYDNADFEGDVVTKISSTETGNKTFYAKWDPKTYGVTLNTNDGTINSGDVTQYTYGVGATLPTEITKEGYEFKGWYDNESFTGNAITKISSTETGNKTFYAQWTNNKYTIKFDKNTSDEYVTGSMNDINNCGYDSFITLPNSDYSVSEGGSIQFAGWSLTTTGTVDYSDKADVNNLTSENGGTVTLYARWSYPISYNNIGDSEISNYAYIVGVGLDLPEEEMNKAGNTFAGWYDNESFTGNAITKISSTETGNKTFYAKWAPKTYSVTLNTNGGTINSGNVAQYTYGVGATLPTDVTKENYIFVGWYDNESFNGDAITEINEYEFVDKTFYAKWVKRYTITFNLKEGNCSTEYIYAGYSLAIEGLPGADDVTKTGYDFAGWLYNDSEIKNGDVYSYEENIDIEAKWEIKRFTIKLYKSEEDKNSETNLYKTISNVEYGTSAGCLFEDDCKPTKDNYDFECWYIDESTQVKTTDSVSEDLNLYAKWTPKVFSIALNLNYGKINEESKINSYTYGEGAILPTGVTKQGYIFTGWYDNVNCDGDAVTEISSTDTGDKKYYAKYEAQKVTVIYNKNDTNATGEMSNSEFVYDVKNQVLSANDYENEDKDFIGWSLTQNGNFEYQDKAEISNSLLLNWLANGDEITLYAVWGKNYTLEIKKEEITDVDISGEGDISISYSSKDDELVFGDFSSLESFYKAEGYACVGLKYYAVGDQGNYVKDQEIQDGDLFSMAGNIYAKPIWKELSISNIDQDETVLSDVTMTSSPIITSNFLSVDILRKCFEKEGYILTGFMIGEDSYDDGYTCEDYKYPLSEDEFIIIYGDGTIKYFANEESDGVDVTQEVQDNYVELKVDDETKCYYYDSNIYTKLQDNFVDSSSFVQEESAILDQEIKLVWAEEAVLEVLEGGTLIEEGDYDNIVSTIKDSIDEILEEDKTEEDHYYGKDVTTGMSGTRTLEEFLIEGQENNSTDEQKVDDQEEDKDDQEGEDQEDDKDDEEGDKDDEEGDKDDEEESMEDMARMFLIAPLKENVDFILQEYEVYEYDLFGYAFAPEEGKTKYSFIVKANEKAIAQLVYYLDSDSYLYQIDYSFIMDNEIVGDSIQIVDHVKNDPE